MPATKRIIIGATLALLLVVLMANLLRDRPSPHRAAAPADSEQTPAAVGPARKPNVVLVITDDQGYGDLSCHGNPVLRTPNLDKLASESVRLTNFHVDPTCSPTRSALMTGRYSTRVGVWHTVMGRHMPRAEERMMPQVFADNGYATAIFGKWHLGDNFPFRPQDRGFQEVLIHGGGGVGQIPDYWGNSYFDDTYFHNGRPEKFRGYCTDVFFHQATQFIESHRDKPFFVYLAPNAPHAPYRVADKWKAPYVGKAADAELASFYGMIANIDDNVGRLRARLAELGLADNTLFIFMTDNGSARGAKFTDNRGNDNRLISGYNAGMRGIKGSPYEGGHRVPCFWHWPEGKLTGGRDVNGLAAHLDLLPTLIDLCQLKQSTAVAYDGRSLRHALNGESPIDPERIVIAHHQEVPDPEKYRFASVMQGDWRLILRNDLPKGEKPAVELYRLTDDPGQKNNIVANRPNLAAELRREYESWWDELSRDFDRPAEIIVGDARQNPSELTCFEWHSSQQWWQPAVERGFDGNGHWAIRVAQAGKNEITLRRWPAEVDAPITAQVKAGKAIKADKARLRIGAFEGEQPITAETRAVTFTVPLPAGSTQLQTWLTAADGTSHGAYYVSVRHLATP
jgi:arylsulfatase A-like enzyme